MIFCLDSFDECVEGTLELCETGRTDEEGETEECTEIGNMTRFGRVFKPENLRGSGDKEKVGEDREAFHKALKKSEYNLMEQLGRHRFLF
uniref:Uncharacterized protein n=1 Tax=Nelumbo nucifera TaxID=4432 RepID=A0A822Y2K3_NELNU|nr:TPA_asm: hypothetical protein HUJ06_027003 [Nelumbo nucifera]